MTLRADLRVILFALPVVAWMLLVPVSAQGVTNLVKRRRR